MRKSFKTALLIAGLGMCTTLLGSGASRAQSNVDGRVHKLESEMRAVQRQVFPGGSGKYFQPQIAPVEPNTGPLPGTPSDSVLSDLTARVNALESQMRTLTGQVEEANHHLRQMEDSTASYRRGTDARLKVLEGGSTGLAAETSTNSRTAHDGVLTPPSVASGKVSPPPVVATAGETAKGGARARLVAAVDRPSTDDPAEDAYIYGYRLWSAKLYPEAETQLKSVVTKYPDNRRASFAQNLLGRAYLDEGKPSLASIAFYENYKKYHDGERAPESLYYLAQSLIDLKKPADACKVYGELSDVYGDKISESMKADIVKGRATANCK